MSDKKLLSGCSDAAIAKWLADFARECAEMRRLTSAPEPPRTVLTFGRLWAWKQETIKAPGSVGERTDA